VKIKRFVLLALLAAVLVGCGSAQDEAATPVADTQESVPTNTLVAPTETSVPPTDTPVPATDTPIPPTDTPVPPTETPAAPVATPEPLEEVAESNIIERSVDGGGITEYTVVDSGYVISLPDGWTVLDLSAENFDEMLQVVGEQNEGIGSQLSSDFLRGLLAAGMSFYAINMAPEFSDGYTPANINVLKQELPISLTLDQIVDVNVQQLPALVDVVGDVEVELVDLNGVRAYQLNYVANLNDVYGQAITNRNVQYLMLNDSDLVVLTVALPESVADDQLADLLPFIEAFRFITE
jgi:hypothetical protein